VTYRDGADDPVFEPWPGEMPLWRQTRVTGLFPADVDVDALRALLLVLLERPHLPGHSVEILEDRDWTREWLKNLRTVRCGERLAVVPPGYGPPDRAAADLVLARGLASAAGTRRSPARCLEWLDARALRDALGGRAVDYGCGSGILTVAAALLGATH